MSEVGALFEAFPFLLVWMFRDEIWWSFKTDLEDVWKNMDLINSGGGHVLFFVQKYKLDSCEEAVGRVLREFDRLGLKPPPKLEVDLGLPPE